MANASYDKSMLETTLERPGCLSAAELERARASIAANGMAVLRNFVAREVTAKMAATALTVCSKGYGVGLGVSMQPFIDPQTAEFRHPYACSKEAVEFATNESFMTLLEDFLGPQPIIHNTVFQVTFPRDKQMLDYHVDCGSVKSLNPKKKFADFRLRTILYLSDVESGGFSYILNSAKDALQTYMPLPYAQLFPPEAVPADPDRRIVVNHPAGTLIIFDTHGLHRPEIPRAQRIVLNTWFARKDFSGNLPGTLFSLGLVPPDRRHRLHIFENERGCNAEKYCEAEPQAESLLRRLLKAIRPPKASSNYASYE